jgi:L-fucose isomerase-like protein
LSPIRSLILQEVRSRATSFPAISHSSVYRAQLTAYVAQGEVLPVATRSFGAIGVFAIPEMGRFYRNVLIKKNYPHHGAVAFGHYGKAIFDTLKYLGVEDLEFNRPAGMLYDGENPYAKY